MNRITLAIARLLDPAEREFVCGDLEEMRQSAPVAVMNILGLALRRQLVAWRFWGPWIALVGVAVLAGSYLSEIFAQAQTGLLLQIRTYLKYGVAYEPGGVSLAQQIAYLTTSAVAGLLWSWVCGFILASLSAGSLWITSVAFYSMVRVSWFIRMLLAGNITLRHGFGMAMLFRLLPLDPLGIVFLLALVLGIRTASKGGLNQGKTLALLLAGVALTGLLAWMDPWFASGLAHWSGKAYSAPPFSHRLGPFLIAGWPLFLLPLLHNKGLKVKRIFTS